MLPRQVDRHGERYAVHEGLAMRELVYYDPDNEQLPTDTDEVQCTQHLWRKFVRSTPSSYASSLAIIDWKGEENHRIIES